MAVFFCNLDTKSFKYSKRFLQTQLFNCSVAVERTLNPNCVVLCNITFVEFMCFRLLGYFVQKVKK